MMGFRWLECIAAAFALSMAVVVIFTWLLLAALCAYRVVELMGLMP